MDIVDLGVADHRRLHADCLGEGGLHKQRAQRTPFAGAVAGNRSEERVGDVTALNGAFGGRQRRGRGGADEGGPLADDAHGVGGFAAGVAAEDASGER